MAYIGYRLGSVSHGTLRPEDLAESFYHEADGRGGHVDWGCNFAARDNWWDRLYDVNETLYPNEDGSMTEDAETISECVDTLSELLNEIAPPYTYFGAHEGDGSDFGFWPDRQSIDELPKYDEVPDTLPGGDFVVVNDHGNVSVYAANGDLLWDIV